MAKLKTPAAAGFNAGKNYYAKMVRIGDIVTDPEISKLFKINEKILYEIYQKILTAGFDESRPVVLQKGSMILLDGHTRLEAAIKAGLEEIPAVERECDRDEAILYTLESQALRRNLTSAEILTLSILLQGKKNINGKGRKAKEVSEKFNIGQTTLYQSKAINERGSEELKQQVRDGAISIKKAAASLSTRKPDIVFVSNDSQSLPPHVKFLKSAVMLLVEANQSKAADMLILHFLKKHKREGFYNLLPYEIKQLLEKEICTPA
jgi:hypothetical protein